MNQDDLIELYNKVLKLTKNKALHWKKGSDGPRNYMLTFKSASLYLLMNDSLSRSSILQIYNSEGYTVAYMSKTEINIYDDPVIFCQHDVDELFFEVEEQIFKLSDTRKALFEELQSIEDGIKRIFYDDCESVKGWEKYLAGEVSISKDITPHVGKFCLKKDKHNDPNGAYKLIGRKFKLGFTFSGWIYRPSGRPGGQADRLAIEDSLFNGYGFAIAHSQKTAQIERRDKGKSALTYNKVQFDAIKDNWYSFELHTTTDGKISLNLGNSSGDKICSVEAQVTDYREFDRITIHGGHPYYIDDLKISITE